MKSNIITAVLTGFCVLAALAAAAQDARLLCKRNVVLQGQPTQLTVTERLFIQSLQTTSGNAFDLRGKLLELHKLVRTSDGNVRDDVVWHFFFQDTPGPLTWWEADVIPTGKTNGLLLAIADGHDARVGLLSLNSDETAIFIPSNVVFHSRSPSENTNQTMIATNMVVNSGTPSENTQKNGKLPEWIQLPAKMGYGGRGFKDMMLSQSNDDFVVTVTPLWETPKRAQYSLVNKTWTIEDVSN